MANEALVALIDKWKATIPNVQHVWGVDAFLKWANEQPTSEPCQHFFYVRKGATVVRCTHCGEMFPFDIQK